MEELGLHFFPYPYVLRGRRHDGALMSWPERCSECDRQCEASTSHGLSLCSYGINYQRVDDDFLIAGIVILDFPTDTPARKKMKAANRQNIFRSEELQKVVERFRSGTEVIEAERRDRLEAVVSEYRETKGYQKDVLDQLRPELEQTLGQVHDYKQFVQQIVQNMVVLLESRFPGLPLEEKLKKAERQEAAIYWAAVIMDEKLDAALFLESPERIYEKREQHRFRLHGMVLKYVRIYESRAEGKRVTVVMPGESWGEISGNSRALGIIPHTLIDNAIKYAPEGSKSTSNLMRRPRRSSSRSQATDLIFGRMRRTGSLTCSIGADQHGDASKRALALVSPRPRTLRGLTTLALPLSRTRSQTRTGTT